MIKLIPINMIQAPNSWAFLPTTFWEVTGGVACDLWGLLEVSDSVGTRPYISASGATMQVVFQRGELVGVMPSGIPPTLIPNTNTVTKTAIFDSQFKALVKISLTAQDATNVISGTLSLTLTEGANTKKWLQNWAIKKINTTAGF